jgi:hypothetical protein
MGRPGSGARYWSTLSRFGPSHGSASGSWEGPRDARRRSRPHGRAGTDAGRAAGHRRRSGLGLVGGQAPAPEGVSATAEARYRLSGSGNRRCRAGTVTMSGALWRTGSSATWSPPPSTRLIPSSSTSTLIVTMIGTATISPTNPNNRSTPRCDPRVRHRAQDCPDSRPVSPFAKKEATPAAG